MAKRVKIFGNKYVYGIGQFPINDIVISDWHYFILKEMGIQMYILDKELNMNTVREPIIDKTGKLNKNLMPSLAITDVFILSSEEEMLKCPAEKGDICIRSDISKNFILSDPPATNITNWKEYLTPIDIEMKTMCFVNPLNVIQGNKGSILQFPKMGFLHNVSAFCNIPDNLNQVELTIERITSNGFLNNEEWEDLLINNHLIFQPNEKNKTISNINIEINANDFFRINIINSNEIMQNLTIQLTVFHQ